MELDEVLKIEWIQSNCKAANMTAVLTVAPRRVNDYCSMLGSTHRLVFNFFAVLKVLVPPQSRLESITIECKTLDFSTTKYRGNYFR